jgi:uncharacterized protein YxjI
MADMPGGTQYRIREKALSLGDDFWIETASGERAYKVDGKTLGDRGTFVLKSAAGEPLYTLHEQEPAGARDVMVIERGGQPAATVRKQIVGLHRRYSIETGRGDLLSVQGDFFASEFSFERDGDAVAQVSDRWFGIHHALGVEIASGEDDALILAATLCVDWMGRG